MRRTLVTAAASYVLATNGGLGPALGIPACLAAGLCVGLLNALLIRALRIPDLVATLASYSMVFGAALIVRPSPGGSFDLGLAMAITARWGYVPAAAIFVLLRAKRR